MVVFAARPIHVDVRVHMLRDRNLVDDLCHEGLGLLGAVVAAGLSRRKGSNLPCVFLICGGMGSPQSLDALQVELDASFAEQLVGEQPPAHANLAMDTPDR
jgi:hypothetical protein